MFGYLNLQNSLSVITKGDRQESSMEHGTDKCLGWKCDFKHVLSISNFRWLHGDKMLISNFVHSYRESIFANIELSFSNKTLLGDELSNLITWLEWDCLLPAILLVAIISKKFSESHILNFGTSEMFQLSKQHVVNKSLQYCHHGIFVYNLVVRISPCDLRHFNKTLNKFLYNAATFKISKPCKVVFSEVIRKIDWWDPNYVRDVYVRH